MRKRRLGSCSAICLRQTARLAGKLRSGVAFQCTKPIAAISISMMDKLNVYVIALMQTYRFA